MLTTDGFELVLHRLPSPGAVGEQYGVRSRLRLVLLMRGLFENSIVWVAGRKKRLAAHLVAGGRDVWLGNARVHGDIWGRRARDWSFEDRARNDLPIMIEYVLITTGADKLLYLVQSLGAALPVARAWSFRLRSGRTHLMMDRSSVFKSPLPRRHPRTDVSVDLWELLIGISLFLRVARLRCW